MADMGSLEKMGRELKCPICLSLLSSAVSIPCNHIFCNNCLTKSMKSASSCPVCKVPFRRREIRPAPHMDNLVSIFKNMEAATGNDVVSTQVAPAGNVADGSNSGSSGRVSKRSQKPLARKKNVSSMKEKNAKKGATASTSCPTTKPSFSTNKRIHVTPFPESETPLRAEKITKNEEPKDNLNGDVEEGKNKSVTSAQPGSPSLSPFFWLREEDKENCTAETLSETLSLDTPLRHKAPTFSDIKDSDDEIPFDTTPNSKAIATEVFDSEIFEWTQRPCSPELCSTPLKKKNKSKNTLDQIKEKGDEDIHTGGSFDKLDHAGNAAQLVNNKKTMQKRKKAHARNSKDAKFLNRAKVCIKKSDDNQQVSNSPKSVAAECQRNCGAIKRNTSGRRNRASSSSKQFCCSKDNSPKEDGLDVEAPDNHLSERTQYMEKNSKRKESARNRAMARKITVDATESNCEPRSKRARRMLDHVMADTVGVFAESGNEEEIPEFHTLAKDNIQHKPSDARRKQSKLSGKEKSMNELENIIPNIGTMTPVVLPGRCQSNRALRTAPSVRNVSLKNNHTKCIEQSGCFGIENLGNLQARPASNDLLKKCEDTSSKVSCAFCQSGIITEESGEMVHYQNRKQVHAELNGGADVVHSHKNCLEWAPDVYFEDESVFNLTTELTRSRRIKCACCGIKGAALGCFEMSCRRSFHFTCAKLNPECRWDNENFVMLCPLHRSSKLPNENSEQQKQSKRKIPLKRPSQEISSQVCGNNWKWPSGSPQKWVLCCSSLSKPEKEIVSEFAKLAGVPISTSWSPNVTHVIASTDPAGACKRTLKFLMAILNGRWIVSINWVKTCMDCMEPIDEQKFEVTTDVHGIIDGPRLGRCRVTNKQPKLFNGMKFYLHGEFTKSYRGYLQELVAAAGGAILQRKPVSRDQQKLLDDSSAVLIVYSVENQNQDKAKSKENVKTADRSQAAAQVLACASGGKVVSSAWIIDSIAACKLQPL